MRGQSVEVLSYEDGTQYLGKWLCFDCFHDEEIRRRINRGWGVFAKHNTRDVQRMRVEGLYDIALGYLK